MLSNSLPNSWVLLDTIKTPLTKQIEWNKYDGLTLERMASMLTISSGLNPLSVANAKSLTLGHTTSSILHASNNDDAPSNYSLSIGQYSFVK